MLRPRILAERALQAVILMGLHPSSFAQPPYAFEIVLEDGSIEASFTTSSYNQVWTPITKSTFL
jgi:hypothetical protein